MTHRNNKHVADLQEVSRTELLQVQGGGSDTDLATEGKTSATICNGVSVLAWARVDGSSL